MSFLDIVQKVFNGIIDFSALAGNDIANRIDRMKDEEIEEKYPSFSVDEMRSKAATMHSSYDRWKDRKDNPDRWMHNDKN